jgi:hypothetical protein
MKNDKAYIIKNDIGHIETVELLSEPKGGMEAVFIQISKCRGVKAFETKAEAERSLQRQNLAHAERVAPKVYSNIFEIIMPVGGTAMAEEYSYYARGTVRRNEMMRRMYGYKTQVARRIGEFDDEGRQYYALIEAMSDLGFCEYDLHDENVGWIGKKLVCIDFGDASA